MEEGVSKPKQTSTIQNNVSAAFEFFSKQTETKNENNQKKDKK
jgi:hypothetical protein